MRLLVEEVEFMKPMGLSGCGQHTRVTVANWKGSGPEAQRVTEAFYDTESQHLEVKRSDDAVFVFPAVAVAWVRLATTEEIMLTPDSPVFKVEERLPEIPPEARTPAGIPPPKKKAGRPKKV